MKIVIYLFLLTLIISCDSDDGPNIQAECLPDDSNELAGCWLYNKCYPSIESPGYSRKIGVALSTNGIVLAQFHHSYDIADCSSNRNGGGSFTYPGTYTTNGSFINTNNLNVTEFHYIKNSGITKKTYYYLNNEELCFPVNSFMGDHSEFGLSMINDDAAYNELNEQVDLNTCFYRVNDY